MARIPRPLAVLHRGVLALLVSVIAGLLIAGMLLPLFGATGLVARAGVDMLGDVPTEVNRILKFELAQRSRVLAADGSVLAEVVSGEDRILAKINEIPPVMKHAMLAIEDDRFYQHQGLDLKGIARALWKNQQAGSVQQGASTLTQQYVKNALLSTAKTDEEREAAIEQTPRRKLREAQIAMEMERRFTKEQILENYFNIAYYGNGAYGVATAAQLYFSKPLAKLTLPEAAMLAGIVQNPTAWNPLAKGNTADATQRRNVVLQRMAEVFACAPDPSVQTPDASPESTPSESAAGGGAVLYGTASRSIPGESVCYSETAPAAAREKLVLNKREPKRSITSAAPYFLDYVQKHLIDESTILGKTKEQRRDNFFRGGLTIRTTPDPKMQKAAQDALQAIDVRDKDPATAIVIIEPGTGAIKAMAVNETPKGDLSLNLATGGQVGMHGGSTFKVFTLAAAIEMGMPLGTTINSPNPLLSEFYKDNGKIKPVFNADEAEVGDYNLLTGTWKSVNTFYIQLLERVGLERPVELAHAMVGRKPARPLDLKQWSANASFTLGTFGTSVLDVANAYATIAARGIACTTTPLLEIRNATNKPVRLPKKDCYRAIAEKTADTLTYILQGVLHPDGRGTGEKAHIGRPAAGKTGTANDSKSAMFAGYTPHYAAAVWMGFKTPKELEKIGNAYNSDKITVYGGTYPAMIWARAMKAIHAGVPVKDFVKPPGDIFKGETVELPFLGGLTEEEAKFKLEDLGLSGSVAPFRVNSTWAEDTVVYAVPASGSKVPIGSTVTLYLSNGTPEPTPEPEPSARPTVTAKPAPTPTPTPAVKPTPKPKPSATPTPTPEVSVVPKPTKTKRP